MSNHFCYHCGEEVYTAKSSNSWERLEICPNSECRTKIHTALADMGGLNNTTIYRLTNEEYSIYRSEMKTSGFLTNKNVSMYTSEGEELKPLSCRGIDEVFSQVELKPSTRNTQKYQGSSYPMYGGHTTQQPICDLTSTLKPRIVTADEAKSIQEELRGKRG